MSSSEGSLYVLRSLDHHVVFHLSGEESLQRYKIQMILTDFQGSAWKATFSLQDVQDSLEAYEPSEEQLLSWLQDAYSKTQPKLIREKGKLAGVEAMHGEGCADVSLRLPPSGAFEEVSGQAAFVEYQQLAGLLCKKCEGASAWAQETSQEVDRLSAELAAEKARADKMQSKLLELQPGMRITASGSFKRPQDVPRSPSAAARAPEGSQSTLSPPGNGPSAKERPSAGPSPISSQTKAPGVGQAKIVHGRGRGGHGGRARGAVRTGR